MKKVRDKIMSLSIGTKLSISFFLIILICLLPLSYFLFTHYRESLLKHYEDTITNTIESSRLDFEQKLLYKDYWGLFKFTLGLLENPYIKEVCFLDKDGKVIVCSNPLKYTIGNVYRDKYDKFYSISNDGNNIYNLVVKTEPKILEKELKNASVIIFIFIMSTGFISSTLGFLIAQRIKKRMEDIKKEMNKISVGNFDEVKKLDFLEKDEIYDFAQFVYKTIQDVKRLYEKLKNVHDFYRDILDSTREIIVITDFDGKIEWINKSIEKFGYTQEELENLNLYDFIDFKNIPKEAIFKGKRGNFDIYIEKVKSEKFEVVSIFDLTDKKKVEDMLRRMEVLSKMGEMSASFAHEVKNAILPIRLLSDINNIQKEDIKVILDSVCKIDRISNIFLNFVKVSNPSYTTVNLKDFINKCLKNITRYIHPEKDIDIIIDVEDSYAILPEDHTELIITNLLTNSIEAILKKGIIRLEVRKKGDKIYFKVEDTGIGIKKDDIDKIFEPFYTNKENGTGLGLSIVLKILHVLGGFLEIESEEGKGTTFTIIVPEYKTEVCILNEK